MPRFDLSFFQVMTPALAYVLGWLASDGCVTGSTVRLALQRPDKAMLEAIAVLVRFTGRIYDVQQYDTRTEKTYYRSCLVLTSSELVSILAHYNIVPAKSLTLQYPQLPDNMQSHFIRGFMDGDGCICQLKGKGFRVSFVGPQQFLQALLDVIRRLLPTHTGSLTRKNGDLWELAFNGRASAIKVMHFIYDGSTELTRLKRKHEKYLLAQEDVQDKAAGPFKTQRIKEHFIADAKSLSYSREQLQQKYHLSCYGVDKALKELRALLEYVF